MLWEAHRSNTVDGDSQNGDEQMDKGDPVGKERPVEKSRTQFAGKLTKTVFILISKDSHPPSKIELAVLPVVIHVLNLPLDKAVDTLAVCPVCETADHAEPVRPFLAGEQLLNGNHNPLSTLLVAVDTHHFLFQTHLRLDQRTIFCLPPPSL